MTSAAQIAANQNNAQLSTGPVTDSGKARSSLNSVTQGLSSAFIVPVHESQAEFDDLCQRIHADWNPQNDHEEFLTSAND